MVIMPTFISTKISFMKNLFFLFISLVLISSCDKKADCPPENQPQIDKDIIQKYIADHNLENVIEDSSGIFYKITKEGNGYHPGAKATVTVKYKGYFTDDNTPFDETTNEPATFPLSNLIEGWQIGIPKLKPDGKGLFLIPSALAYGCKGSGKIQANTVLIFEIELVTFE